MKNTHMRYHTLGGIASAAWGNGLKYQARFDALGRVTRQTQGKETVAYQYDKAGNIVVQGDRTYTYDKLDRVTGATRVKLPGNLEAGDIRYQYDANGNRTEAEFGRRKVAYKYQPNTNWLSSINDVALKYDKAGNLIKDGRFTYSYNSRNRLAKVSDKQVNLIAAYIYNALGLRTSKSINGKTTYYVNNPNGMLAAEADSKGSILRQYVWLGIRPLALIEEGRIYFIHTDHLGTPRVVTNGNGTEVWRWEPTPFGLGKPTGSITLNLRFPGQYFDAETGLNYNWHRYYHPTTGRFLRAEPTGLDFGMNPFRYALASPVSHFDANGLWASSILTIHQGVTSDVNNLVPVGQQLSQQQLDWLIYAVGPKLADAPLYQGSQYSYRHAMRGKVNGRWDTELIGRIRSNCFVRKQFKLAWLMQDEGKSREAMGFFGLALHTLQDSTSPVHNGFQPWGDSLLDKLKSVPGHLLFEEINPGTASYLYKASEDAFRYFKTRHLPDTDLFTYGSDSVLAQIFGGIGGSLAPSAY